MARLTAFVLLIQSLYCFTFISANLATTPTSEQMFYTQVVQEPSETPTPDCGLDTTPLCPPCDGGFRVSDFGFFLVECDTSFTNVTYYEYTEPASLSECLDACFTLDCCVGGVVWPNEKCLVPCGDNPQRRSKDGWAIVAPLFTGALPVPILSPDAVLFDPQPTDSTTRAATRTTSASRQTSRRSATTSSTGTAKRCEASSASCPGCDGAYVRDARGVEYQISCGRHILGEPHAGFNGVTAKRCMRECDALLWFQGFTYHSWSSCDLFANTELSVRKKRGNTAFLEIGSSHTETANVPSSTAIAVPCQVDDIRCPFCDGAYVKDSLNQTYHVLCDNNIFSEQYYAVQRQVSPEACMVECDDFPTCKGSKYWPEGNCQLARGEEAFPQERDGYTALLPVDLSYTPPPPKLSAYPTGAPDYAQPQ